jgi:hypothetical protein
VAFYRGLGFFARHAGLSDHDLAARLAADHLEEWGEPLPPPVSAPPLPDVLVMTKDPQRAWWLDLECDALPGNDVYAGALTRLAEISDRAFDPAGAHEAWNDAGSRATVTFDLAGSRHEIRVRSGDGWFDVGLIARVNDLLDGPGRFCVATPGDQTIVVLFLDEDQATRLAGRGVDAKILEMEIRR